MKQVIIVLLFIFLSVSCYAQYFYYNDKYYDNDLLLEGGLSLGLMNAATDVGKRSGSIISPGYYDWGCSNLSMGLYFGAMYKSLFGARLEFTRGVVGGMDSRSNSPYVVSRNLSYKSSIFEATLTGQFYPLALLNKEELPALSPYVLAGFGLFSYFPKAMYDSQWVSLRSLHTEGQNSVEFPKRKEYGEKAWCLPMGIGVKYDYSAKINFRFEGIYRLTTTDYLDDASTTYVDPSILMTSQRILLAHRYRELLPTKDLTGRTRGSPGTNDRYFSFTFKVGYLLGRNKIPINDIP